MVAAYLLTLQPQHDIKKIPKTEKNKIKKKLLLLEKEPFSGKKLKEDVK